MPIVMEDTHVELIENGVPLHEQTMTIEKPFWAFFTGNMLVAIWLLGVFIAGFGLNLWQAIAVIMIGNFIGCIPLGLIAIIGPRSRLSQIESSRLSFGKAGAKVSAVLNWVNSVGWDSINNVPAAAALTALIGMIIPVPFWLALAIIVIIQLFIGIYGHHLVQLVTKYVGWAFLVILAIFGANILTHTSAPIPEKIPTATDFIVAISLAIAGSLGYAPYTSDYTRYLPRTISSKKVFWAVVMGSYTSVVIIEIFGVLTAGVITDQTPAGFISALTVLTGSFAPLVLIIVALSSTPPNAMNDNSAAYCFISAGIPLPRPISAVIGAIAGFTLAAWGAGRFAEAFENYLLFLFYWIAPWTAIVLVHWFMIGRHETEHRYARGWTMGATIFVIVTLGTIALFSASPLYTSPAADALGGIDIGYYVGFIVAGLWYWLTLKYGKNRPTATEPEIVPA